MEEDGKVFCNLQHRQPCPDRRGQHVRVANEDTVLSHGHFSMHFKVFGRGLVQPSDLRDHFDIQARALRISRQAPGSHIA